LITPIACALLNQTHFVGDQGGFPIGGKGNAFLLEGIKTHSVKCCHPLVTDSVWLFFVAKPQSELPIAQGVGFDGSAESIKNLPEPF
jgi:hypothetical protein